MKERINRLAKGIIETDLPKVIWPPDVIEDIIRTNTTVTKEFYIGSENGLNVKGLVYSSNMRVCVSSEHNAFGGLRNHIAYEVDTSFLSSGDEIRGSFFLVTNCGEREIPYIFHVDLATTGKILGELNTVEDFLEIARRDMETALRLLEYQGFMETPFMQDMHNRAVYDGLKGHGSRQNFMEEFLVALGVKPPMNLEIEKETRIYEELKGRQEDFITVSADTWGYVYIEISADGSFIHLPKKSASQADFENGVLKIPFVLLPEHLHSGRNLGAIILSTAKGAARIPIEALAGTIRKDAKTKLFKTELAKYLELRLDYESGIYEKPAILNYMRRKLDLLELTYDEPLISLFQAEIYMETGHQDKACDILDEQKERVLSLRQDRTELYCFFQYLQVKIWGDREQKDSLIRLLQRYCSADGRMGNDFMLYLMLLRVNENLYENPATVLISMEQEFKEGCRSPFLYAECLRLLERQPSLLRGFGGLQTQTFYFAAKRLMLSHDMALLGAKILCGLRSFKPIYLRILWQTYEMYQDVEILTAICALLIRGDLRGSRYFEWYEKGVQAGISLTRLNEYYLYSLPEGYNTPLPREILLYFSYANELDYKSRAALYRNILSFMDRESDIYKLYERSIEKFAMEQLFEGRINQDLSVIYQYMLYKELIDRQLAMAMPPILMSHQIICRELSVRYVVVRHEELLTEEVYPLIDGVTYVPLYSKRDILLFQDAYGNRYLNIQYVKTPVMGEVDELLKQCFKVYPEDLMLLVNACREIIEKKCVRAEDAALLERVNDTMHLHPLFLKQVTSAIVRYYRGLADESAAGERDENIAYLLCVDKDALPREERNGICETLIKRNYDSQAYDMICRYGIEGLSPKYLLGLCAKMVLQRLFDEDDKLLNLAYFVFKEENGDSVLLDYLCEHYNGTSEQMYEVLIQGIKGHVETYDLEERLLAQMLFTGNTDRLDKVFDLYASRKKMNESIMRAYFTIKSMEYFLYGKTTEDKVFSYLEGAVNNSMDKDKVADIYLLALTKYYSTLTELNEEQRELCQAIVDVLLENNMLFSYFKALSGFISIPGNVLDKEILEYHGQKGERPYLQLRVLPEEEEYHFEEMRMVYKGIYTREKVLFEGEILEYRILEDVDGERKIVLEGSISCKEVKQRSSENRFACLNEMSLSLDLQNENLLRSKMEQYLERSAVVAELFTIQ